MNDPTLINTAQIPRCHLKEFGVMRQKVTGRGLKQRKCTRQGQADPGEGNQGSTIVDHRFQKTTAFSGHRLLRAVMPLQPLESAKSSELEAGSIVAREKLVMLLFVVAGKTGTQLLTNPE